MLNFHWTSVTITTNKQANNMIKMFWEHKPKIGGFDTETNGLHIIASTPFIFQFGWVHPNLKEGYTFLVHLKRQPKLAKEVIKIWLKFMEYLDVVVGHNIIFDLHMLTNIGFEYKKENLTDTMFWIRYGHDTITIDNGGPPLKLKEYAARYIDHKAKSHEKLLNNEKSFIAKELNLQLKIRLKNCGIPPEKYKAKSYTLKVIQEIFKDPLIEIQNLPKEIQQAYLDWLQQDVPIFLQNKIVGLVEPDMIPYNILNEQNIIKYAHYDIIYTLEIFFNLKPIVKNRENIIGVEFENKLIFPIFEMERVGFKVNKNYIKDCQIKMKEYIYERREKLYQLAKQEFKIGQHELIKKILNNNFNIETLSTSNEELERICSELIRIHGENNDTVKLIQIIQELRTLEKWYTTYILRFIRELQNYDKLYTNINLVGTVSGRVTSSFQQFPRNGINKYDGTELFYPRKMVIPSDDEYNAIIYLDYSQIELRFQAIYTILIGCPDLNLCRAYMPFKCHRFINNIRINFDHNELKNWKENWFLNEKPDTLWSPIDVHGATAFVATGLTAQDEGYKEARYLCKTVNFAKNYGAAINKIRQMFPMKTEEEIQKIDKAYYKTFPGIKQYQQYCYNRANNFSYTMNVFGIRYYGVNGHKLINLLIQGSSAYFLKMKIRELYDYCKINNIKSKFQMNIHDELSWERHKDEAEIFFKFQKIMEDWPDSLIPIVAEMAVTKTTWAEKKEVSNMNELQIYLGS